MFGETEVNLFYLLIAAIFLFVCFPYTLKRTAVNDTNSSKTQTAFGWHVIGMHVYSLILDMQLIY